MSFFNSDTMWMDVFRIVVPALLLFIWRRHEPRRPPGPQRYPLLGSLLQMPSSNLWERALEWRKEYGDLVYLENLGKPMLIINSYEVALELLGNRSAKYSSRPHLVMASDLEGWDWILLTAPYGERLRKGRSFQHRFFNSRETSNFLGAQLSEARRAVKNILDKPDDYEEEISRLLGGLVMMNVYGHRKDRLINLGVSAVKLIAETEQYFLPEFFPSLKYLPEWFPGTKFHQAAKDARKVSQALHHEAHDMTKKHVQEGSAKECMSAILLAENTREDGSVLEEDEIRAAAATLFIGGVHTTSTAIMTFILGLLKNPEAQRLGQAEIDRVVGVDRLPTFDDKDNLPYVKAMCEEALRYGSVAPLGFPHFSTEDDVYQGYHIPAGTTVLANQWYSVFFFSPRWYCEHGKRRAMSYNPEVHEDPLTFRPERWLCQEDGKETDVILPHNYSFGFGRRACVGQKWAEHLLFITAATILATCNIEKAIGKDGNPIEPNDQYESGFARSLGASKCKITPRSQKVASLLEASVFADFGAKDELEAC
ncbi:cytochrome P450 [Schizopora paradoxa]|uniref:Cytochrome P450 n=1 Tax=Schizopora paradoxa TaxID=27342 RepID=A0A0H2S9C1_9AGAM|nr:cytochrome P450 [Schizopora paradoxa]